MKIALQGNVCYEVRSEEEEYSIQDRVQIGWLEHQRLAELRSGRQNDVKQSHHSNEQGKGNDSDNAGFPM